MPFRIIRNDITKVKADAIVNTANPKPVIGSGTDSAVYAAAGKDQLLEAREKIGPIARGSAAWTEGFGLKAKYIIHTVGPVWQDGNSGEADILRSCYERSLAIADELKCKSIAFPLLASGNYGFPKEEALQIALAEIGRFLLNHEMLVTLVVFDSKALTISQELMGEIDQYISDHAVFLLKEKEYKYKRGDDRNRWRCKEKVLSAISVDGTASEADLSKVIGNAGKTFQQKLFELIDARGLDDVTVYKKANLDRKLFSAIRCKVDYHPKKETIFALALALELDLDALKDLLGRAGMALSPSILSDVIIEYFFTKKIYDLYEINAALAKYGQKSIGP